MRLATLLTGALVLSGCALAAPFRPVTAEYDCTSDPPSEGVDTMIEFVPSKTSNGCTDVRAEVRQSGGAKVVLLVTSSDPEHQLAYQFDVEVRCDAKDAIRLYASANVARGAAERTIDVDTPTSCRPTSAAVIYALRTRVG